MTACAVTLGARRIQPVVLKCRLAAAADRRHAAADVRLLVNHPAELNLHVAVLVVGDVVGDVRHQPVASKSHHVTHAAAVAASNVASLSVSFSEEWSEQSGRCSAGFARTLVTVAAIPVAVDAVPVSLAAA